jgi:endonuclease/exonuclease/phosphatase family metal-dependent hydrolase
MTILHLFVLSLVAMVVLSSSVKAQSNRPRADTLLESGQAEKLAAVSSSNEIEIVSYNIRWRSGEELQQIVRWLKERIGTRPALIGLQEVDRAKKRSGSVNHARTIADELGLYYSWTAPPQPTSRKKQEEEETGVELLSSFPLSDITRIVLPNPGPNDRVRVALGATTKIGNTNVRVYSVHSETRLTIARKVEQLRAVLDDVQKFPNNMPVIVVGDFNTWELPAVEGIRKLFSDAGFTAPLPDDESTFYRNALMFDVKLKLDWIWLRGLTPSSYGIDRNLTVSDHFPLWTTAKVSPTPAPDR